MSVRGWVLGLAELFLSGQIVLTHLSFDEPYTLASKALSYDGAARSISSFYAPKRRNFSVGGFVRVNPDFWISANYDNGHQTQKVSENQSIMLGFVRSVKVNETQSITVSGSHKFGGSTKHVPCTDDFGRSFYCATMTAFVDFKPEEDGFSDFSVKWRLKF